MSSMPDDEIGEIDAEDQRRLLLEIISAAPVDMSNFGLDRTTVPDVAYLGSGSNGHAFLLPDGETVLKYTADWAEAGLALRLIRAELVDGLPIVFYTARLQGEFYTSRLHGGRYLIVMEAGSPVSDQVAEEIEYMLSGEIEVDESNPFVQDIASAVRFIMGDDSLSSLEALSVASNQMDFHSNNLGIVNRDGREMLVAIDLGQYNTMDHVDVKMAKNSLTPNPTDDRLKFILKTYGEKKPWVVAGMARVIAATIGDDDFYGSLLDAGGDFGPASIYRDARRGLVNTTLAAEVLVAAAMTRPRFRERHAGDPLFSWMAQQLAKADTVARSVWRGRQLDTTHPSPFTVLLNEFELRGTLLVQWYKDTRPNLGQFDASSAFDTAEDWKLDNAENGPVPQGELVAKLPDKWTLQKLKDAAQLDAEGKVMQHCVGSYAAKVAEGDATIFSLRDAAGRPHVTIEVSPSKRIKQVKGKQNSDPTEKYQKYVDEAKEKMFQLSIIGPIPESTRRYMSAFADVMDNDQYNDNEELLLRVAEPWEKNVPHLPTARKWMAIARSNDPNASRVVAALLRLGVTPEEYEGWDGRVRHAVFNHISLQGVDAEDQRAAFDLIVASRVKQLRASAVRPNKRRTSKPTHRRSSRR